MLNICELHAREGIAFAGGPGYALMAWRSEMSKPLSANQVDWL